VKRVYSIISILFCIACFLPWTDEEGSRRALKYSGYTDIRFGGHSFFACPSDWSATEFLATNPVGLKRVPGTVFCGLFMKACTVRF